MQISARIINYSDLSAKTKWDLLTFSSMAIAFVIYITPLSSLAQRFWQQLALNSGIRFVPGAVQIDEPTSAAPLPKILKASPQKGDIIAGYQVTSPWGSRNTGIPGASTFHEGVDLGMPIGTQLHVIGQPGEKVQVRCWQDSGRGGLVASFRTSWGTDFDYLHLSKCQPGEHESGRIIALSGNSGVSSGPHAHITQRKGRSKVPPQSGYLWWAVTGSKP
jgi:murein DD-endopeptidase MepM/ murein hydrolase activator NlpD